MDDDSFPEWLRPPDTRARRSPRDPLLTPPDSPRKRVRKLRDSEDTDGEMTIESYSYRTNPYRSSTIPNPPPYPVNITEVSDENFQPHYTRIEEILYQHGFPNIHNLVEGDIVNYSKGRFQVAKMSKPNYPGGETPRNVFLILFFDGGLPK
ncbi:uncharacterized protein TRUGW13939_02340 [Talaromyces rugulosus]|uniref:Uncharacterized protein n=1 Tax=Talaromyces rugulosus TaxID=121627 RepID=A0A7H8QMY7_TALRU|nr:uncharacterized protein TRUGW13939_02340 [Talaromyces rugulosus]QKX55248.1 hypothetical protein TRUGW13939_02340 [Talaromyces rugulosus]